MPFTKLTLRRGKRHAKFDSPPSTGFRLAVPPRTPRPSSTTPPTACAPEQTDIPQASTHPTPHRPPTPLATGRARASANRARHELEQTPKCGEKRLEREREIKVVPTPGPPPVAGLYIQSSRPPPSKTPPNRARSPTETPPPPLVPDTTTLKPVPPSPAPPKTKTAPRPPPLQHTPVLRGWGSADAIRNELKHLATALKDTAVAVDNPDDANSPFYHICRFRAAVPKRIGYPFFYANVHPREAVYDPYHLVVTSHKTVESTHYLVSDTSVTRVACETTTQSLDSWLLEYGHFKRLWTLKFFRSYHVWRAFTTWRCTSRSSRVQAAREQLSGHLFAVNRCLGRRLFEIRELCLAIGGKFALRLLPEAVNPEHFFTIQAAVLKEARGRLSELVSGIMGIASSACREVLQEDSAMRCEQEYELLQRAQTSWEKEDREHTREDRLLREILERSSTLNVASEQRLLAAELCRFLNLVDFMVTNSLVNWVTCNLRCLEVMLTPQAVLDIEDSQMIVDLLLTSGLVDNTVRPDVWKYGVQGQHHSKTAAVEEIEPALGESERTVLKAAAAAQKAKEEWGRASVAAVPPDLLRLVLEEDVSATTSLIWAAELVLNHDTQEINVSPNPTKIANGIDKYISALVDVVKGMPTLRKSEVYHQMKKLSYEMSVEDEEEEDSCPALQIIEHSALYTRTLQSIKTKVQNGVEELLSYTEKFEPYVTIWRDNLHFTPSYIEEAGLDLDWYRQTFKLLRDQVAFIDAMPVIDTRGMFVVGSKSLRGQLKPSPMSCIQNLSKLLPVTAAKKNHNLIKQVTSDIEFLLGRPDSIKSFATFLLNYQDIDRCHNIYREEYDSIASAIALMKEERVEWPIDDNYTWTQETVPLMQSFDVALTKAEAINAECVVKYTQEVSERIKDLEENLSGLLEEAAHPMLQDESSAVEDVLVYVSELEAKLSALTAEEQELVKYQGLFGLEVVRLDCADKVRKVITDKSRLWHSVVEWEEMTAEWLATKYWDVDLDSMLQGVARITRTLNQISRTLPTNPVVLNLRSKVDEMRLLHPVLISLRNGDILSHHIEQLTTLLGHDVASDCTVHDLLGWGILDIREEVHSMSHTATQEAVLEGMLSRLVQEWQTTEFTLTPFRTGMGKPCYIISAAEDILAAVDESKVTLTTIVGSRYCTAAMRERAEKLHTEVGVIERTLGVWSDVQRNWMWLQGVFGHPEASKQWAQDMKVFALSDRAFRDRMELVAATPRVYRCIISSTTDVCSTLIKIGRDLEKVIAHLELTLDSKRRTFPRFYFVSNDDLIELLSIAPRTLEKCEPHLLKLFPGVASIEVEEESYLISSLLSPEGEVLKLPKPVRAKDGLERWMGKLEEGMHSSLRRGMKECIGKHHRITPRLARTHVVQVALLAAAVHWTVRVDSALACNDPRKALARLADEVREDLKALGQSKGEDSLTLVERRLLSGLLCTMVHNRAVLAHLAAEEGDAQAFLWQRQLRCEVQAEGETKLTGDLLFHHFGYTTSHGLEYVGAVDPLVITPLTDRVFLLMTTALRMNMGGMLVGPAGTGKTETVKALARAMGKLCVAFNCSGGLGTRMVTRFVCGLCQCGAWCSLDELNRVRPDVLSVVAHLLGDVFAALGAKSRYFSLQGQEIILRPTVGVFVTLNPSYTGRVDLPRNLTALFRRAAVVVPDVATICETILCAQGVPDAQTLAERVVLLYRHLAWKASPQPHYDWGLRNIKSMLHEVPRHREGDDSDAACGLVKAIAAAVRPVLVGGDVPIFEHLVESIFPTVSLRSAVPPGPQPAQLAALRLHPSPDFMEKVGQLASVVQSRRGVMVVGESGCGKTAMRGVVRSLTSASETIINPKTLSYGELFGAASETTKEWHDGWLFHVVSNMLQGDFGVQWVVFDGPVHTFWLESLNSALDDNATLCFSNNSRLPLPPSLTFLFETESLCHASVATVSRCGLVHSSFMSPESSDGFPFAPLVAAWESAHKADCDLPSEVLLAAADLLRTHLPPFVRFFVRSHHVFPIPIISLVAGTLAALDALVGPMASQLDEASETSQQRLLAAVAHAVVCGMGGGVQDSLLTRFSDMVHTCFPDLGLNGGSPFDYRPDSESGLPAPLLPRHCPPLMLPVEMVGCQGVLELIEGRRPLLVHGASGVGKTALLSMRYPEACTVHFTSSTRAEDVRGELTHYLRFHRGGTPKVLHVDDMCLGELGEGEADPLELIRDVVGRGVVPLLSKRAREHRPTPVDVVASCAAAPNNLPARLLRHFHAVLLPHPARPSLNYLLRSMTAPHFAGFADEVTAALPGLLTATVEVYHHVRTTFLPSPGKAHYRYNPRDLFRLIRGLTRVTPKGCSTLHDLHLLWLHEVQCAFAERINVPADRLTFTSILTEAASNNLKPSHDVAAAVHEPWPAVWGDYLRPEAVGEDKVYEQLKAPEKHLLPLFTYYHRECLEGSDGHPLVLYRESAILLARLLHAISGKGGHAVVVGMPGTGGHTLARLAAAICGYECFSLETSTGYTAQAFHDDLLQLADTAAGVMGQGREGVVGEQPVELLLHDAQLVEGMLPTVAALMGGKELAVFTRDDRDVRMNARLEGESPTQRWARYADLVRSNLHVVLCMSPAEGAFDAAVRTFPAVASCSSVLWMDVWPHEALEASVNLLAGGEGCIVPPHLLVRVHTLVTGLAQRVWRDEAFRVHVTPSMFFKFVGLVQTMEQRLLGDLGRTRQQLAAGIATMRNTDDMVRVMEAEMKHMKPQYVASKERTDSLLASLLEQKENAKVVRATVSVKEAAAQERQQQAATLQNEAQSQLHGALPELREALKAVDSLSKQDIIEIRSYTTVPKAVATTIEAVFTLLREKVSDWGSCRQALSRPDFLERLTTYNRSTITPDLIAKLEPFLNDPDFVPERVGQGGSYACKSLCMWVRAVVECHRVELKVAPKREKLLNTQRLLHKANCELLEAREELEGVEGEVADLQERYDKAVRERASLKERIAVANTRLDAADALRKALQDQVEGWKVRHDEVLELTAQAPYTAMMCSAYLTYLGPFAHTHREEVWEGLLAELRGKVKGSIETLLSSPAEIREWTASLLPSDRASVGNATIITKSPQYGYWPLIIDPDGQAARWLTRMEMKNGLKTIRAPTPSTPAETVKKFCTVVDKALEVGSPLMVTDVDGIPPYLLPVVLHREQTECVLGGRAVQVDPGFRLYMTCASRTPTLLPDVVSNVSVVNFSLTREALVEQLQLEVILCERADLDEAHRVAVQSVLHNKRLLASYENTVLSDLETVEGCLLDNSDFIIRLQKMKHTSDFVSRQVAEAEEKMRAIEVACNEYAEVPRQAAALYFVVAGLWKVDPMYRFSIHFFVSLFSQTLHRHRGEGRAGCTAQYVSAVGSSFVRTVFARVSAGLHSTHSLAFAFQLAAAVAMEKGEVARDEWDLLCSPGDLSSKGGQNPSPASEGGFLDDAVWGWLQHLEKRIPVFSRVTSVITTNLSVWRQWLADPSGSPPPPQAGLPALTLFQHLVLVVGAKRVATLAVVAQVVERYVGKEGLDRTAPDLHNLISCTKQPTLLILHHAADPTPALRLAAEREGRTLHVVSIGEGQDATARRFLEKGRKAGLWLVYENCHLSPPFVDEVEQMLHHDQTTEFTTVHPDFRLWLTSVPSRTFSPKCLHLLEKVMCEPPGGLRSNLLLLYDTLPAFQSPPTRPDATAVEIGGKTVDCAHLSKSLLHALCFLHSVLVQRHQYIPMGWTAVYDFDTVDLESTTEALLDIVKDVKEKGGALEWDHLREICYLNYCGRVTDPHDEPLLRKLVSEYIAPEMTEEDHPIRGCDAYLVPHTTCGVTGMRNSIEGLPVMDNPVVLGLQPNALAVRNDKITTSLLASLGTSSLRHLHEAEVINPTTAKQISLKIDQLKAVMPDTLPCTIIPTSPMQEVLRQEVLSCNRLVTLCKRGLEEMRDVLQGESPLNLPMAAMYNSLLSSTTPAEWREATLLTSPSLSTWVARLKKKVDFFTSWLKDGLPPALHLASFSSPRGLLTSILQEWSRKENVPFDQLSFAHKVLRGQHPAHLLQGSVITGLYCDSFCWNNATNSLDGCDPTSKRFTPFPPVLFEPRINYSTPPDMHPIPLFCTLSRQSTDSHPGLVCTVNLPSPLPSSYWVISGSALVTHDE